MNRTLPIVFVHRGASTYLHFSLRQARAAAPDAEIVLIGDESNASFGSIVRHVSMDTLGDPAAAFRQVYTNRSKRPFETEIICFERWFYVNALAKREGWADLVHLDSDTMLYANTEALRAAFDGCRYALNWFEEQEPYLWAIFPHVAYWQADALAEFCAYSVRSYADPELDAAHAEKWAFMVENGEPGGVMDMTTLYRYQRAYPEGSRNLSVRWASPEPEDAVAEYVVDRDVNESRNYRPGEYRMAGARKALSLDDAGRMTGTLADGTPVRMLAVHFQGQGKRFMPQFYTGPRFPGQQRATLEVKWYQELRRWAAKVVLPIRSAVYRLRGA